MNRTLTAAVALAEEHAIVRPSGHALHIAQNRAREKRFLADQGVPSAPCVHIRTEADLLVCADGVGSSAQLP